MAFAEMPVVAATPGRMLPSAVRILIADNHDVIRVGLQVILEAQRGWHVVASASDGKEALQKAVETKPDIAVIGHPLALFGCIDVTRQIKARLPRAECLIFTMHEDEMLVTDLLRAGARGYLLKSDTDQALIEAIKALASHKTFFTPKVSEALLHSFTVRSRHEGSALTARERQVVQLIAEGLRQKLHLSSPVALARYAIRNK